MSPSPSKSPPVAALPGRGRVRPENGLAARKRSTKAGDDADPVFS